MFQNHRSHDAVITICQDNTRQTIEIRDMNRPAEEALGYIGIGVSGRPLMQFLPQRIQALLSEYVEYEEDGNDVGNVLSKVQSFCVLSKEGKEISFKLKVIRSESLDKNAYFRLILQDKAGGRRDEAFRAALRENFKGHEVLDARTGLPDRQSITKDLELVHFYVGKETLRACFAVVEVDGFDDVVSAHGADTGYSLIKHLASIAKQNLRGDDTIGYVAPNRLGIVLIDTNVESARMVLNRLRWLMAATPLALGKKENLAVTVSISYSGVSGSAQDKNLLQQVEGALGNNPKGGNQLVEVAA